MKVLFLGVSSSRNSGGILSTSTSLGKKLKQNHDLDIEYLLCDDEFSLEDRIYYNNLPIHVYKVAQFAHKLGLSFDIHKKLNSIKPDLIHTQCMWMYISYASKKYYEINKNPYIVQPHGMLDSWQLRQSKLKKKIVLSLYERDHIKNSSCLYSLCDAEYKAIRDFGLSNPVAIIPNGVNLPSQDLLNGFITTDSHKKVNNLLFLSRIHPKKGLENLLVAWAITKPTSHNWNLLIAGDTKDEVYLKSLHKIIRDYNLESSVKFIGGQFGINKHFVFQSSDAFILPSFSEGLPMAVLEAWSYKLPVIMTPFCNLPEGFRKNAAVEVDTNPESIASGISKIINLSLSDRIQIGKNGFNLVQEKFTWEKVAEMTNELYMWITNSGNKPSFVY